MIPCDAAALVVALIQAGPLGVVIWLLVTNRSLIGDLHASLTRSGGGGENPHGQESGNLPRS